MRCGLSLVLLCSVFGAIRLRDAGMTGSLVQRGASDRMIVRTGCRHGMADADARHEKCHSNKGAQKTAHTITQPEEGISHGLIDSILPPAGQ